MTQGIPDPARRVADDMSAAVAVGDEATTPQFGPPRSASPETLAPAEPQTEATCAPEGEFGGVAEARAAETGRTDASGMGRTAETDADRDAVGGEAAGPEDRAAADEPEPESVANAHEPPELGRDAAGPPLETADQEGDAWPKPPGGTGGEVASEPDARPLSEARSNVTPHEVPDAAAEPVAAAEADLPAEPDETVRDEGLPGSVPDAEPAEPVEAAAPPSRSRWDAPGDGASSARDTGADGERRGALVAALRVAVLVVVVGGALYGGLMAVRPEGEAPPVVVQAPRVVETRAVPASPGPAPPPLRVERFVALRDLDLRGHRFGLVRVVPQPPQAVCEAFVAAGWSSKGWGESPLGGMSECVAERGFGPKGAAEGFAILRGRETLLEIRVKLNLTDLGSRKEVADAVGTLLAGLFDRWHWDGGSALGVRIAALQAFEETRFGTKIVLKREHGDVERWNLILRFPSPPEPEEAPGAPTMADIAAATAQRAADPPVDRDAR